RAGALRRRFENILHVRADGVQKRARPETSRTQSKPRIDERDRDDRDGHADQRIPDRKIEPVSREQDDHHREMPQRPDRAENQAGAREGGDAEQTDGQQSRPSDFFAEGIDHRERSGGQPEKKKQRKRELWARLEFSELERPRREVNRDAKKDGNEIADRVVAGRARAEI